jgi:putative FmdB family regulatory protein
VPIYEFLCRDCKETFEARAPVGAKVAPCRECHGIGIKQFVPTGQIRITEGFKTVSRSDVCAEKGKDWKPKVWPSAPMARSSGLGARNVQTPSPEPRAKRQER